MHTLSVYNRVLLIVRKASTVTIALAILLCGATGWFLTTQNTAAVGNTYTICDTGCDFTSLTDAIAFGVTGDTLIISNPFTFDDTLEDDNIFFPADLTLECEAGVTFGDAAQDMTILWPNHNNIIQDCTLENVSIDTTFGNNIDILRNTFSAAAASSVTLTNTDGFQIRDNIGIQKVQAQAPKNGLIDGNQFECRFNDNCINLVNDTPENIIISNNTITNYNVATGGDWVNLQKGTGIQFIDNTIQSVTTNDGYITILTAARGDHYIARNYIIFPDKGPGATNGTWGINLRIADDPLTVVAEHNTIVHASAQSAGGGDAGIGIFDDGSHTNVPVSLTANYNIFYQGDSAAPSGHGVRLEYVLGSADVTFSDSFNGIYNAAFPLGDATGTYTSLNANTLYSDPLFRQENVATADDYYLNPISRYLDADGTNDIGAFGDNGVADRIATYLIDDDCTVDYATCFSNTSAVLRHAVKMGDDVTIAAGTYGPITLDYPADGVSIAGAGSATIIDAAATASALGIADITNSSFSGFQATGASSVIATTYETSLYLFDFDNNSYNQTLGIVGSDNVALLFQDAACGVVPVFADGIDVTTAVGAATDDWNVALVDLFNSKITLIFPGRFASNATEAADYVLNNCGASITVDAFIPSVFTVSGGIYTYNSAAVSGAGASLMAGLTDPPELTRLTSVPTSAGIVLTNATGNTFTSVLIGDNTLGVHADAGSVNNEFILSAFTDNDADIYSLASGTNTLTDTSFALDGVIIDGQGEWEVYYTMRANVTRISPPGAVNGATVEVRDAGNNLLDTIFTGMSGLTPFTAPVLAHIMSGPGPYTLTDGGYNPHKLMVSATGLPNKQVTFSLASPQQQVNVVYGSSGGGGGSAPSNIEFSINDGATTTSTRSVTLTISAQHAASVVISNGSSFDGVEWEPYTGEPRAWELTAGDGEKTVCILLRSVSSDLSPIICDTIELRTMVPPDADRHPYYERYLLARLLNEPLTISTDKELSQTESPACVPESLIKLPDDGNPATQHDTTVYYCGTDGRRHVFPNEATYFSWYPDFSGVRVMSPSVMASIIIGENVTVRPGSFMVKFITDPRVYAVAPRGVLRWVGDEFLARLLYGDVWNRRILDISDAFFSDYRFGTPIVMEDL